MKINQHFNSGIEKPITPVDGSNHSKIQNDSGIHEPITPIDGRYRDKVEELAPFFSEYALMRYRMKVELAYLKKLSEERIIPGFSKAEEAAFDRIFDGFNTQEFRRIKDIEDKINHDVKAVEYYLREKFNSLKLAKYNPYIHIALTSYDTNDVAYALILKESRDSVMVPLLEQTIGLFKELSEKTKHVVMLGRTHGQPAVPTTFGKEMANYVYRLRKQLARLKKFEFEAKCTGAVGNFNAHVFAYPKHDWVRFSKKFISSFGLQPNLFTTQLLAHDNWIEYFQIVILINGILVDCSVNFWLYIMLEVLVQKKNKEEVGSSTMPQKVNPINFENAEGVLQLANSQFEFYERKLVTSRLQRDLSDSTIRRTFGIAFSYTVLGWKSMISGIQKIMVNEQKIQTDLDGHWEILAEALQTYLRSVGDTQAYEKLKELTRGKKITKETYIKILRELHLEKEKKLLELKPETYVGLAEKLVSIL